ncbi:MAG: nickel pincer cofactor biosynthesis protein LarB [Syntrophorhabdaceae bacterium]|nr:nickel pincer cofactor biosynthesis protein LarB [Syntrophorhabdaceae bacterium]
MIEERLIRLLKGVRNGEIEVEGAIEALKDLPYQDLEHTKVDHHRIVRRGMEEVVFGEGKSAREILDIIGAMREKGQNVLVTRIGKLKSRTIQREYPEGVYNERGRCFYIKNDDTIRGKGVVLIVSAGTSDARVAEEAYVTSLFFGNKTERLYDVGVAGIHRLFQNMETLKKARVIIVTAGMEGALPSVVAGIVNVPVIGVPTSVGYGANFGGLSALLAMLNSCSTISVFNIDNGFGAAYFATLINRL